jgi:HD superfamily phosphohydrolase YqeK
MGMGTNHSTLAVARGMEELTKATHSMTIVTRNEKAGVESREVVQSTYRESLKRLGYETEDQVALVADYLSLQRATMSAEQFRAYTNSGLDKEVAVRTLEYAKSLKLIADLTGASASEVAKEARARSLSSLSLADAGWRSA